MNRQHSFLFLPLFIALSLLAAFVLTTPVFAQDETPPTEPAPEETPVEEAAPLGETLAEAGVEVVDESGEAIPLAAEALTAGDPWFKVGTTVYTFLYTGGDCTGIPNCTITATPLQDAVSLYSRPRHDPQRRA